MRQVRTVLTRMWAVFCIVSVCAGILFIILDRDNPLHSDDPYVFGLCVAAFSCGIGLSTAIVREFVHGLKIPTVTHFAIIAIVSAMLLGWDYFIPPPEGQGLPTLLAIMIAGGGLVSYPLLVFSIRKEITVLASLLGTIFLSGYAFVLINM